MGVDSNGFNVDIPDRLGPPCSVWLQDCDAGEKCTPWANDGGEVFNATRCSPIAPNPDAPGDACTVEVSPYSGLDSCDGTSMCFGVDGEGFGSCQPFCVGDETQPLCTDPSRTCVLSGDSVLTLCLPDCDPLLQDCSAGEGCYPFESGFVCAFDDSEGAGFDGVGCEALNSCAPGLMCVSQQDLPDCEVSFCCSPYCSVSELNTCEGAGEECVPLFERGEGPPQFYDHGVCSLP